MPSKCRNVSGILVEKESGSFLILDYGEGTISQLVVRMRGREGAERLMIRMKCVYISHMHADHHLGLINIIQMRERAFISRDREVQKLYIICTNQLSEFLIDFHSKYEPVLSYAELVKWEQLLQYFNAREEVTNVKDSTKKPQFHFAEKGRVLADLRHAVCLALGTSAGFKLAYSSP